MNISKQGNPNYEYMALVEPNLYWVSFNCDELRVIIKMHKLVKFYSIVPQKVERVKGSRSYVFIEKYKNFIKAFNTLRGRK